MVHIYIYMVENLIYSNPTDKTPTVFAKKKVVASCVQPLRPRETALLRSLSDCCLPYIYIGHEHVAMNIIVACELDARCFPSSKQDK